MQRRQPKAYAIIGGPGVGKSTFLSGLLDQHYRGRNVLIYKNELNIDDKAFRKFRRVLFARYAGGWAKISDADVPYKAFTEHILKSFKNGALVIDDCSFYERNSVSETLHKILIMRRHMKVDIFLVFHGLTGIPIDIFKFLNGIVLFPTGDNPGYKAGKLPAFAAIEAAIAKLERRKGAPRNIPEFIRTN